MKKLLSIVLALVMLAGLVTLGLVPAWAAQEQTIEDMFSGYTGGSKGNLRLKLEGDTATFSYSPTFYVTREYPGYPALTDEEVTEIIDWCVAGIKRWEGEYEIRGRTLTLVVNVDPKQTDNKSSANFGVLPRAEGDPAGNANFDLTVWRPEFITYITLYPTDPRVSWFYTGVAAHEFGHALGITDAYSYGNRFDSTTFFGRFWNLIWGILQPEAPEERVPMDGIMRSGGSVIYNSDVEMALWAWKHGKYQLYTNGIATLAFLFFEFSPAFS